MYYTAIVVGDDLFMYSSGSWRGASSEFVYFEGASRAFFRATKISSTRPISFASSAPMKRSRSMIFSRSEDPISIQR